MESAHSNREFASDYSDVFSMMAGAAAMEGEDSSRVVVQDVKTVSLRFHASSRTLMIKGALLDWSSCQGAPFSRPRRCRTVGPGVLVSSCKVAAGRARSLKNARAGLWLNCRRGPTSTFPHTWEPFVS